ncbi:hypothetical protein G7Y89_g7482 [Cudoniella acicularis]|uniref:YTH domain-containing protein n=1 Tax=Cudoniella acicularis TaxID=354080 RepID=A0A8H4W212_9HELO|nr:hypothetical protein G7Y89_g7482 [Cudoniella acicularis]
MGDTPLGALPDGKVSGDQQSYRQSSKQSSTIDTPSEFESRNAPQGKLQSNVSPSSYPNPQQYPIQQHASQLRPESFNLGALAGALPEMSYQNYGSLPQQRHTSGYAPSGPVYQMPNIPQYGGSQTLSPAIANSQYNMPYQGLQGVYAQNNILSPQLPPSVPTGSHFFQGQGYVAQQTGSPYYMQFPPHGPQSHPYVATSPVLNYGMRSNYSGEARLSVSQPRSDYLGAPGTGTSGRLESAATSADQFSIVRGPPRKPRQSGHAIWIGNLPPQTDIMSLVLHVCKETVGLESLFLISKSNCAFANYKDEAACAAAQGKIHDSRFQTVRLVGRLRRTSSGTAAGLAAPTGPAALTPLVNPPPVAQTPSPEEQQQLTESSVETGKMQADTEPTSLAKDKFFIVKSLTVEDLELSVRNGIWATQSHNEEALNKAYQNADNVFLIFSANKSGEYFGYARMTSPINDDPAAAIEFAPKAQSVADPELPKAISTPATEFAPKGRIIDDSARGTIFWEAERDEETDELDENRSTRSDQDLEPPSSKAWGKPFKIEWISTMRLPFYRTRGLRNPWNSNREVKIARDGTELETSIGRKLIGLFHRLPSPVAPQGLSLPMMDGYPPMRPFP